MSLSTRRTALALLVGLALIAATLLATPPQAGAAKIYACKKPSGSLRLVSKATRCRRGQKKLSWNTIGPAGRNGANGSNGANGQNGARGPAGAFNVIDATGANVGLFAGFFIVGPMVYLPNGAVLMYDNNPASPGPFVINTTLYYKTTGCGGTPYTVYAGTWPFELPVVLQSPPSPGSTMYSPSSVVAESFSSQSTRTSTGCRDAVAAVSSAYPVAANGVVPIVQEPLRLQPVS